MARTSPKTSRASLPSAPQAVPRTPRRPRADATDVAALVAESRRAKDERAAQGRQLLAVLRQHLASAREEFVAAGRVLRALLAEKLYWPLGYATFDAMLASERLPSRARAFKLMAVAAVFEQDAVRDFGVERAMALIAYARATVANDDPVQLLRANALIGGVAVRDATAADLERARREVLARQGGATSKSAAAAARAKAERLAVKGVLAALAASGLPKPAVTVTGRRVVATWSLEALAKR